MLIDPKDWQLLRAAVEVYGLENQKTVCIEEMSELTKELCKNTRGKENPSELAEEIADVEIMLEQMIIGFGETFGEDILSAVMQYRRKKLERLALLIKINKGGNKAWAEVLP